MTAPTIRAALEAAAMTIDPDPDMPPPHVVRDITGAPLTMAAATIAAFLRALPGHETYDWVIYRDGLPRNVARDLALAVEAAAKEGGA